MISKNKNFEAAKKMIGKQLGIFVLKDVYWETVSPLTGKRYANETPLLFAELICPKCLSTYRMLFLNWLRRTKKYCPNCSKKSKKKYPRGPSGKVALGLASGSSTKVKVGVKKMLQLYSVEYVSKAIGLPEKEIRLIQKEKIRRRR